LHHADGHPDVLRILEGFDLAVVDVGKPSPGTAGEIAELFNELACEHYGEKVVDADEVAHWFGLPQIEFWVATGPSGELAAYADLHEEDKGRRYWLDLREHPGRRELGGAEVLLKTAQRWAGSHAAPDALLRGTVSSLDEPLRRLYEKTGYRLIRHMLEMRVELEVAPVQPEWPEGISLRTFVPEDEQRLYAADMEAFEDHWEFVRVPFDEWRAWLVDHPRFEPSLWFLIEEGPELVGFCLCGMHSSGDPAFGHVVVLGVRRPWRRRGLGLALLRHAFGEFHRRGMTKVGLDVDAENLTGAVRLYERAGMYIVKRRDVYEKLL
jgi:mycothiol synthase